MCRQARPHVSADEPALEPVFVGPVKPAFASAVRPDLEHSPTPSNSLVLNNNDLNMVRRFIVSLVVAGAMPVIIDLVYQFRVGSVAEEKMATKERLWTNHEVHMTDGNCLENSSWCTDSNHTPRHVGDDLVMWAIDDEVTIRHYSHYGFDKCLADKTVVFVGDSRVRYQYMHLVSYLKTERFMKCRDYPNRPDDPECSLIAYEGTKRMSNKDWN